MTGYYRYNKSINAHIIESEGVKHHVNPGSIERCVGILDINGKEVYAGDIVKDESGEVATVCWDDQYLEWFLQYEDDSDPINSFMKCEIIDNEFNRIRSGRA